MYDAAVIGGGIVGLATAYEYLQTYPKNKLILLEKESELASHQTGNNSGVIHSGIYYKPGSSKAINCRTGIRLLLDFCNKHDIEYELCGKLIVATSESEIPALRNLYVRGRSNGINDLRMLNSDEVREIEPHVSGVQGIHSPSTGIIDYKNVCDKIAELINELGGDIHLGTKVIDIIKSGGKNLINTNKTEIEARVIINCSGLYSDRIAKLSENKIDLRIIPFRGEYFRIKDSRKYIVKNLIYPVPDPQFPFLGVHFTRRIDGTIEAGPNAVLAFAREGYKKTNINLNDLLEILTYPAFWKLGGQYWKIGSAEMVRSFSKKRFVKALQKLIPDIGVDDVVEGGSGVRAQALSVEGMLLDDFKIVNEDKIIHVLNAPSPAATSAFAIAKHIISFHQS